MSTLCTSYAHALYSLAAEEGLEDRILEELELLTAAFDAEPDYLRLLSSPNLSKDERCEIVENAFRDRVHPYVFSTLSLLTERKQIRRFSSFCKAYRELYDEAHGILAVSALTAIPLGEAQAERLRKKLETITGKTVRIQNRVDPACMGGVRLDYDDKRLDGTVQGRLASLGEHLKKTVL